MPSSPSSSGHDVAARKLELVDYRRRVADLYTEVRRLGVGPGAWQLWSRTRVDLLTHHPQSPLDRKGRARPEPVPYFDYDPTWRVIGTVHPLPGNEPEPPSLNEERSIFAPIGSVAFERGGAEYRLGLFWLQGYGGGLFLPFRDVTNGDATYGGGRYLLDGAKSADLGGPEPGTLLLDFNFSYHPSCAWDPIWPCPLAPPENDLPIEVTAGERLP